MHLHRTFCFHHISLKLEALISHITHLTSSCAPSVLRRASSESIIHQTSLKPSSSAEAATTEAAALIATAPAALATAAFTVTASFLTAFTIALTHLLTCLLATKGIEAEYHVQHSIAVDAVVPCVAS